MTGYQRRNNNILQYHENRSLESNLVIMPYPNKSDFQQSKNP